MSNLVRITEDEYGTISYLGPTWRVVTQTHQDQYDDYNRLMWRGNSNISVSQTYQKLLDPEIEELEKRADALADTYETLRRGVHQDLDAAFDAYNGRIAQVSEEAVRSVLPLVAEADPQIAKQLDRVLTGAHFEKYGGCSCPCSPALVLGDRLYVSPRQVDLYLDVLRTDA